MYFDVDYVLDSILLMDIELFNCSLCSKTFYFYQRSQTSLIWTVNYFLSLWCKYIFTKIFWRYVKGIILLLKKIIIIKTTELIKYRIKKISLLICTYLHTHYHISSISADYLQNILHLYLSRMSHVSM